jgi:hypothetical protein
MCNSASLSADTLCWHTSRQTGRDATGWRIVAASAARLLPAYSASTAVICRSAPIPVRRR